MSPRLIPFVQRLAMLAAASVLASCATVGPNYQTPKAALINAPAAKAAFVGAQANPAVTAAALPGGWWRLYNRPDLDRLVNAAFAANTDLRAAEAHLERSRALLAQVKAMQQPNVSFNLDAQYAVLSGEAYLLEQPLPGERLYDTGFGVSYQADLFGRLRRGVEAAKADDEAVAAARDVVRVSVAADVARAYAEVCGAGAELVAAQNALRLQQQSLALTQRLVSLGRASRLDVTRSQGQVEQLRANVPSLLARRRNALYRLATLTGRPPAEFDATLEHCVTAPSLTQALPVGDGAALLKRRPDVREAERFLAASTAEIGVATAGLYPDITLGASVGSTGVAQDFLERKTNRYGAGGGIAWQLNQSGPRARIEAANAVQKAALARFDGTVLTALREVESALNVYSHDLERQQALEAVRARAQSGFEDAKRFARAGRGTAQATLDAERLVAGADSALAAIRAQVSQDQIALFLSLGGGWQADAPPTT